MTNSRHNLLRITCASALILGLVAGCNSNEPSPEKPLTAHVEESSLTQEGVPGGISTRTATMIATVTAIDYTNRSITLEDKEGGRKSLVIGPEAVNFNQIEKGDQVRLLYVEETLVYLKDLSESETASSSKTDSESDTVSAAAIAARAAQGDKPGGLAAVTAEITAVVMAIDLETHTATLRFPDGSLQEFPVREDVRLSEDQVGREVVIQVTSALAISVEKVVSE